MDDSKLKSYLLDHAARRVKIAVSDIDGILRGKYISVDKFIASAEQGLGFCDVVFGWDASDLAYDSTDFTGWHSGYPDMPMRVDLSTFRKIPWEEDLPFFLADFSNPSSGDGAYVCPRTLLKSVIAQSRAMGYEPIYAQEFEWFNFEETPDSIQQKKYSEPKPITPGMFGYSILRSTLKNGFMSDLFDLSGRFGIPLEGLHTETGPGVYEAAIAYTNALEAADRAVLFKTAAKEIGYRHGILASFMAKWNEDLPGCSGHIHQSLMDKEGKTNLFFDHNATDKMSVIMKQFIAGQLHCIPFILPLIAPTVNSYKRLVEGAWAPTTLTWGHDNRTVALRVLAGGERSSRIETRIVGSDTNPYLAMAACLAAGLYGIRHQLELTTSPTIGNGYKDTGNGVLATNLWEATQRMKNSDVAAELFGDDFVRHFCQTREWEWRQYSKAVTNWELKRYFEII